MRSSRRRYPRSTRTSYPGAGGPQDACNAQPARGRRASRCRSRGPVHRRAPHGRPGPARHPPRQVPAHHAQRTARAVPGRPRQKAFQRVQAERAVGRRHSPASGRYPLLRTHLLRVGLRRLRHRCLLAANRGLADLHRPVCTDLALDALQMAVWQRKRAGADLTGLVHHLRPRGAVQVHPLRASPGRVRGGRLCRL